MLPKIKVLDKDHLRVNDYLIDMVAIRHWFESQTWPAHSPEFAFRRLVFACETMDTRPQNEEAIRAIVSIAQRHLAILTTYGGAGNKVLYVPDDPFIYSCGSPFVRGPTGIVMTAMIWQSNAWRQISKTWWKVQAGEPGRWTDEYALPFLDPEWVHPWGKAYT